MTTNRIFVVVALLICLSLSVDLSSGASRVKRSINWNGNNWALGCDWWNNDMWREPTTGEQCGGKCAATSGCTHFTWTNYLGGSCWLKSGAVSPADAFQASDPSAVCGYMQTGSSGSGSTVGQSYSGVLTTRHPATEAGACQLPETSYISGIYPVALGNIDSLGALKFQSGLCGKILRLDCGHGPVNLIVSNANLGGGLDLYASAWDLATGHKPPGQEWCTVQLTNKNSLASSAGPVCYYAPESEKYNDYFHLLGLFNTGERIVSRGTLDGRNGDFNSLTSYIAFYGGPISSGATVTFWFTDGSSHSVRLSDCVREDRMHTWS